ncbi:Nn.00g003400.m01.CDS01 [Neocucurbitaria sp. VM-36]
MFGTCIAPVLRLFIELVGFGSLLSPIYESGILRESLILPFLPPSLVILAGLIGDGSVVLCVGRLQGPTAGVVRTLANVLKRELWYRNVQRNAVEDNLPNGTEPPRRPITDDGEAALQQINSTQLQRPHFTWFPGRLRRVPWRSPVTRFGDAYTDDEAHEPAVELSSQFLGQRGSRIPNEQSLLDVSIG